ncbi:hypothetical protein Plim_0397 [Planctopirus limnophila DSM 3776]|uniref:Uncharacterized protein n=1 Tax=Planctopirus limnophila (strain ATCC 43296 / DSM 3776 / IFAM 1008 / Mu 290) TaxID=521674 RepID=D5SPL7_PLAL2|nr:hypothetical protein [Planctopirus limnophila]ADG66247.1 hypothetical protein Plim_0397 [Planctopirus limnophila DSM 3776]
MKFYFLALGTVVVVCVGCAMDGQQVMNKGEYHAPPAAMMMRPGPMVDGPGPGVMPALPTGMGGPMMGGPMMGGPAGGMIPPGIPTTTQVRFVGPDGMHVGWQIPDGYAENQLVAPARFNFQQAATYRLKLTNIPGRAGLNLYPTLQVYPSHPNTVGYLSHNSVPLQITVEDLDQVESNNFVTKVIYLPDAKYQELAIANVETLVSTRLDPGVDPVQEADKRGTIMAILRLGNMDLEMPGAPGAPGATVGGPNGGLNQVAYNVVDGDKGQHVPPMPMSIMPGYGPGVPDAMMVAGYGLPGQPAGSPYVSGVGMPMWGQPITGTPIGLAGPPHLPYGGPAGLKSHTIRNRTKMDIPEPVDHMLIDVEHAPGLSLPKPVRYVEYKETHPVYSPGELSNPAWNAPGAGAGGDGAYCPPGMQR